MPTLLKSRCPHCQATIKVSDTLVGKRVRCPACKEPFEVASVEVASATSASLDLLPPARQTMEVAASDTKSNPVVPPSKSQNGEPNLGQFGRFELREVLGEGAFGRVYRAYDPQLDREVAIKFPTFGLDDQHKIERFITEARSAARLRHANIVPVYDIGEADGQHFIVAHFVRGESLAERIKQNPPDFRQSAEWVRQLASALAYAHGEGIIHRDIKPANIMLGDMLDSGDLPQLMDFGLAKRLDDESARTTEGSILGTPAYMSPEQAQGKQAEIGPLSDQYSLGVVLYELLTGQKPFEGPPYSVIAQVLTTQPPTPHSLRSDVPDELALICQKAMSKKAKDRFANCQAFAAKLGTWLEIESNMWAAPNSGERSPIGSRWHRQSTTMHGLIASGALLCSLIAVVAIFFRGESPPAISDGGEPDRSVPHQPNSLSKAEIDEGWKLLFDGKSLDGWRRESSRYWNVKDGEIIAKTATDRFSTQNTFLIWEGGRPDDFELRAKYKISGGNAGIQYRSTLKNDEKCIVEGYQADIDAGPLYSGAVWEEGGRQKVLAERGERITIGADGKPSRNVLGDSAELQAKIKSDDWNDYRIVVRDNHFQHYINGTLMAELIENERPMSAIASGVIALQFDPSTSAIVRFKDLRLKPLMPGADESGATTKFLSELPHTKLNVGNGGFSNDGRSPKGSRINVKGEHAPHAIFLHPPPEGHSEIAYRLDGQWTVFQTAIAVVHTRAQQRHPGTPLTFLVLGDGKELWSSEPVTKFDEPQSCEVSVRNVNELELRVSCPGASTWAHAVFLEPRLIKFDARATKN